MGLERVVRICGFQETLEGIFEPVVVCSQKKEDKWLIQGRLPSGGQLLFGFRFC